MRTAPATRSPASIHLKSSRTNINVGKNTFGETLAIRQLPIPGENRLKVQREGAAQREARRIEAAAAEDDTTALSPLSVPVISLASKRKPGSAWVARGTSNRAKGSQAQPRLEPCKPL